MKAFLLCLSLFALTVNGIIISLTFDDSLSEHFRVAQLLSDKNVTGTFYTISGKIGLKDKLTLDNLNQIKNWGHEIGSHTVNHLDLTTLSAENQTFEICQDRFQLQQWGFKVTTFAFPFGADSVEAPRILSSCGFNAARDSGGIKTNTSCLNCPTGNSIPPANPYLMRSISYRSDMGVEGLKSYVTQAENAEAANPSVPIWLVLIFHEYQDVDNGTVPSLITDSTFTQFLNWAVVRPNTFSTVASIIGGISEPILNQLSPPFPTGRPYIAFTFDQNTVDHFAVAQLFKSKNMTATFYVNPSTIGQTGFLNISSLLSMQLDGHEIGSGTKSTADVLTLSSSQQNDAICGAKQTLSQLGLNITSMSWPSGSNNATVEAIAASCGFASARDVGGIRNPTSCSSCPTAEAIPLTNSSRMSMRSFSVKSYHTLGNLMFQVTQAEQNQLSSGKNMLVFAFGTVCNGCAYSPTVLGQFLDWLSARYPIGTQVATVKSSTLM